MPRSWNASYLALRQILESEVPSLFSIVRKSYPDSPESHQRTLARHRAELNELGNRHFFVAQIGEVPVAYVQLVLRDADNDPDLANGQSIAHVHDLRVAHSHLRQGIGREMMLRLETYAASLGFEWLTLGVDSWNEPAAALYRELGYGSFKGGEGERAGEYVRYMKKAIRVNKDQSI